MLRLYGIPVPAADDAEPPKLVRSSAAGGDWTRLRGLPAIGRNVRGAIPGTSSGDSMGRIHRERLRR